MNDILEIALIIDKQKYHLLYKASIIISIIIVTIIGIIFTYKYQSYYKTMGAMIDDKLELLVDIDDVKYLKNNKEVIIEGKKYYYQIISIDEKLYRTDNYQNYKKIYLKVDNLSNIDNYVYEISISKENKTLASYIKDFIKEV